MSPKNRKIDHLKNSTLKIQSIRWMAPPKNKNKALFINFSEHSRPYLKAVSENCV